MAFDSYEGLGNRDPFDPQPFKGILLQKELKICEKQKILNALADAISKPDNISLIGCHFPVHGIQVFHEGQLQYHGTLCWYCMNFSFSYPSGKDWLGATSELKKVFTDLLSIPKEEMERFYEKYPGAKP